MCDINKLNAAQTVAVYLQIRDRKAALEAKHKEELRPYNDALGKLEEHAVELLKDAGVDSMRTVSGTVYSSERLSVSVADRELFMDHIKSKGAYELLDVRPNKSAVKEYMVTHQDVPPGVTARTMVTANFRRA